MPFYSEELNRSETKFRKFAQITVREKVIEALLYFNRKFGQTSGQLNFKLTRKKIADLKYTIEEQVASIFSTLKKNNHIKWKGNC